MQEGSGHCWIRCLGEVHRGKSRKSVVILRARVTEVESSCGGVGGQKTGYCLEEK